MIKFVFIHIMLGSVCVLSSPFVYYDHEVKIARDMYKNSIFLDELPYREKIVEELKVVHNELKNIYFNPNGEQLIEGLIKNSPQVKNRKELASHLLKMGQGFSHMGRKNLDVEWEDWTKTPEAKFCDKKTYGYTGCIEAIGGKTENLLYTFDLIAKHVFKKFKKPFDAGELKYCFMTVPSIKIDELKVVSKSYESLIGEIAKRKAKVVILCGDKDDSEFILTYDKTRGRFHSADVLEVEVPYVFKEIVGRFFFELGYYKANPDRGRSLLAEENYMPTTSYSIGDSVEFNKKVRRGLTEKEKSNYRSDGVKVD